MNKRLEEGVVESETWAEGEFLKREFKLLESKFGEYFVKRAENYLRGKDLNNMTKELGNFLGEIETDIDKLIRANADTGAIEKWIAGGLKYLREDFFERVDDMTPYLRQTTERVFLNFFDISLIPENREGLEARGFYLRELPHYQEIFESGETGFESAKRIIEFESVTMRFAIMTRGTRLVMASQTEADNEKMQRAIEITDCLIEELEEGIEELRDSFDPKELLKGTDQLFQEQLQQYIELMADEVGEVMGVLLEQKLAQLYSHLVRYLLIHIELDKDVQEIEGTECASDEEEGIVAGEGEIERAGVEGGVAGEEENSQREEDQEKESQEQAKKRTYEHLKERVSSAGFKKDHFLDHAEGKNFWGADIDREELSRRIDDFFEAVLAEIEGLKDFSLIEVENWIARNWRHIFPEHCRTMAGNHLKLSKEIRKRFSRMLDISKLPENYEALMKLYEDREEEYLLPKFDELIDKYGTEDFSMGLKSIAEASCRRIYNVFLARGERILSENCGKEDEEKLSRTLDVAKDFRGEIIALLNNLGPDVRFRKMMETVTIQAANIKNGQAKKLNKEVGPISAFLFNQRADSMIKKFIQFVTVVKSSRASTLVP